PATVTFSCTSAPPSCTVPGGVDSLSVVVIGGAGGNGSSGGSGGGGARVSATVPVRISQIIGVQVGCKGLAPSGYGGLGGYGGGGRGGYGSSGGGGGWRGGSTLFA